MLNSRKDIISKLVMQLEVSDPAAAEVSDRGLFAVKPPARPYIQK
jgi:hypothetical protein